MSRDFEASASADYFLVTDTVNPVTLPWSAHAWFTKESSFDAGLWAQGPGGIDDVITINSSPDDTSFLYVAWNGGAGSSSTITTNSATTGGAWNHLVATVTSTTQDCTLNGDEANRGSTTNSLTEPTWGSTSDKYISGANSEWVDGLVGMVSVWDVALSADERQQLWKGVHPFLIRPLNLVHHYEMDRASADDEPDYGSYGEAMIAQSAPVFVSNGPPVIPWHLGHDWIGEELVADYRYPVHAMMA
jgi:hypothetical protein